MRTPSLRPTPEGLAALALSGFLFLLATNLMAGWLFFLVAFLLALLIVGGVTALRGVRHLRVEVGPVPPAVEGGMVALPVVGHSSPPLPSARPAGARLRDVFVTLDAPPESPLSLTIIPTWGSSSPGREFERGPEVRSRQFARPPGAPYTDLTLRDSGRGGGRSCMVRDKLVLTYQDYLQMPDDRNRREILSGDLYVTPAPTPIHQRAVVNLITLLQGYLARHKVGKLYASPVDVVLSQVDVVQPDLVFVSNDRLHLVTEMSIQGAPDLVVEILSPSTARLDRGRKMDAYARFGVREYWIADTDARTLEIYRLKGQNLRLTSTSEATALSSAVFPDLTFDLQSLWD